MKLRTIVLSTVFLATLVCAAQTAPPSPKKKPERQREEEPSMVPGSIPQAKLKQMQEQEAAAKKDVLARETALYEAEKRKDWNAVLDALSDDFIEVGVDGSVYHKAQIAQLLPGVETTSFRISDVEFKLLAPDTALIVYHYETDTKYKGEAQPKHWRSTSIWTRKKGAWLARYHTNARLEASAQ